MSDYIKNIKSKSGIDRFWEYVSWANERDGYYTPDQLIDLSLQNEFRLDNPLSRIRKGTKVMKNAVINGSAVDGDNVIIGSNTTLEQAHIVGSNVNIGQSNIIRGNILVDNININNNNKIKDILGKSPNGTVEIGSHNQIESLTINNEWGNSVFIGNYNQLHPGLTLNNPFSVGFIFIGDNNDLGNGGGGVISSSFRYAKGWGGHVIIDSQVEMTRGAEIGGLSLVGGNMEILAKLGYTQENLTHLFAKEEPLKLLNLLEQLSKLLRLGRDSNNYQKVGLFGTAKIKRCCVVGHARIRDEVRIQGAFIKNTEIRERCKIFYSSVSSESSVINISVSDRAIENQTIYNEVPWESYPVNLLNDDYLDVDYDFYKKDSRK